MSAVQIEVIWEALPALPERVLGYEVRYDSAKSFVSFFVSSNMIIELFPVACLAHNCPFIVLKMSFSPQPPFLNFLIYLLMYLCKDSVLSVII